MKQLIDPYGRIHTYLRVSLTDRCNMRCVYCMPEDGIEWKERDAVLSLEEIERMIRIFASRGITKVRFTGGEPLIRRGAIDLIAAIKKLSGIHTVGITTNGVLLRQYAQQLHDAGVDALNISLDTLRPERFARIARREYYHEVLTGIHTALDLGFPSVKLNVVAIKGINDDELIDFVTFATENRCAVRFIEYMPFKANGWNDGSFISYREMIDRISARYTLTPMETHSAGVAKDYSIDGYAGTVSFITSMSCDFCSTCSRIRMLADGAIKSCLFFAPEMNLRDALRKGASDESIGDMIGDALSRKSFKHPPMDSLAREEKHSMIEIGG